MKRHILLGFLLVTHALNAGEAGVLVPYPEGFRAWRFLGSVVSHPKDRTDAPDGMIHHIYGNEEALAGLRTGVYPEGAVLVADWFLLKGKYAGSLNEGTRDRTDVMRKDARFATTGGWGYDQFAGESRTIRRVNGAEQNQCFKCHAGVENRGYVFTILRP